MDVQYSLFDTVFCAQAALCRRLQQFTCPLAIQWLSRVFVVNWKAQVQPWWIALRRNTLIFHHLDSFVVVTPSLQDCSTACALRPQPWKCCPGTHFLSSYRKGTLAGRQLNFVCTSLSGPRLDFPFDNGSCPGGSSRTINKLIDLSQGRSSSHTASY